MTSLSFPDVNVWLALILENHIHRASALEWWNDGATEQIGFCRVTQMSVLRLLTTAAAMDARPLTMSEAWAVYDAVLEDERVALYSEPAGLDAIFRSLSLSGAASPKLWADAYLVAFASGHQGHVVTFDRAMRDRGTDCIILHQPL